MAYRPGQATYWVDSRNHPSLTSQNIFEATLRFWAEEVYSYLGYRSETCLRNYMMGDQGLPRSPGVVCVASFSSSLFSNGQNLPDFHFS